MKPPRILFISNLFPNPLEPHRAAFSRQQITALSQIASVDVIAPIAWTNGSRCKIPPFRQSQGNDIFHPTFWYTPGILRFMYGKFYLSSIHSIASRLLASRNYDFIFSSWLFPDGWAAVHLAKEFNLSCFLTVVGTDANRLLPGNAITEKSLWTVDNAAHLISVSRSLKNKLVQLGADSSKISVVNNGVDRSIFHKTDRVEIRAELEVPRNKKLILYVGNLLKTKGMRELVLAFNELTKKKPQTDLELVLIGAGPCRQEMHDLLEKSSILGKVRFLGTKTQKEIAQWMNAADVFCLPSYSEGQPNVVIEALACQTRIVATNVGGIPDLDEGQGNMILVPPRQVEELAQALEESLATEMPVTKSDFICTWQENAEQLMQIFKLSMGKAT